MRNSTAPMQFLACPFQRICNTGASGHVAKAMPDQDRPDLVQASEVANGFDGFQDHRLLSPETFSGVRRPAIKYNADPACDNARIAADEPEGRVQPFCPAILRKPGMLIIRICFCWTVTSPDS